jgi:predicted transcriptional regulator
MADGSPLSLDPTLAARLEAAARAQGRSVESIAEQAINSFLDWDDDFRAAVRRGVSEADAGVFATDKQVEHVFRKRT